MAILARRWWFTRPKKAAFVAVAAVLVTVVQSTENDSWADAGYPTDAELKVLPIYCTARLRSNSVTSVELRRWIEIFGKENWTHLHHYCQELNLINRADKTDDEELQKRLLRKALGSLRRFVDHQIDSRFALVPEVYYHIGTVSNRLGNLDGATQALNQAIRLKPDYALAYSALSDIYRNSGQVDAARVVINIGLKYAPKSKALLWRKSKLEETGKEEREVE